MPRSSLSQPLPDDGKPAAPGKPSMITWKDYIPSKLKLLGISFSASRQMPGAAAKDASSLCA